MSRKVKTEKSLSPGCVTTVGLSAIGLSDHCPLSDAVGLGVLHVCVNRTRDKTFRRSRTMCAILWAARLPRASMAAQAAWQKHSPHRGECFRPSGSAQLQRTADLCCPQVCARAGLERCPPAHNMGDLSRLTRTPTRLRIRSVHATEVFWQPRSAHVAPTPINLFKCHRRR